MNVPSENTESRPLAEKLASHRSLDDRTASETGELTPPNASGEGPTSPVKTIGPYAILGELGRGGMGIVYKARHSILDRIVALKIMRAEFVSESPMAKRFDREMRAAAGLAHPNIVPILEIGQHAGRPYYTMPHLTGGTLAQLRLQLLGDVPKALALVEKIAGAVHYAHDGGVLHRDLKPANVLLDEQGEPQVSDFGLAKIRDAEDLTQTGDVLGTPAYMAPEQAGGRNRHIDARTDVWALGVILYELIVGRRPFAADSGAEVKHLILTQPPTPPTSLRPDLDPALEGIMLGCLEKDPARRCASAAELVARLGRFRRGDRSAQRPVGWRGRVRQRIRRHAKKLAAIGLAVVMLCAWAGSVIRQFQSADPVTLIAETDGPGELRWIVREKEPLVAEAKPGAPFTFTADGLCMLELLPTPPWEYYRVAAEIRHLESDTGQAGIFVGLESHDTPRGRFHSFWTASFSDHGLRAGGAGLALARCNNQGSLVSLAIPLAHPGFTATHTPGSWRTVAIEVSPRGLQAFLDHRLIGEASPNKGRSLAANLLQGLSSDVPAFPSHGKVGIFQEAATTSFRNVIVLRVQ